MITFQGFKPSGLEKIANAMGFQGEEKDFKKFLEENPDRQAEMLRYQDIAIILSRGIQKFLNEHLKLPTNRFFAFLPI